MLLESPTPPSFICDYQQQALAEGVYLKESGAGSVSGGIKQDDRDS